MTLLDEWGEKYLQFVEKHDKIRTLHLNLCVDLIGVIGKISPEATKRNGFYKIKNNDYIIIVFGIEELILFKRRRGILNEWREFDIDSLSPNLRQSVREVLKPYASDKSINLLQRIITLKAFL